MTLRRTLLACMAALALPLAACGDRAEDAKTDGAAAGGVLNLYTARHYDGDLQVYAAFEKSTGIKVNRIEGTAAQLIARMQAEGAASPADVFVTADAGALWRAQNAGLLQPVTTDALTAAVPANLREPEGHFFGMSRRARVVAYDSTKVRPEEIDTYEDLASPRFRGKLCVRSSDHVYNLSLVGALLEAWGPEKTRQWVEGVVANMARPPEGGDRDQIRAVGAGVCEVAITNSYYYVRMDRSTDAADVALTDKVKLGFPSLDGQGAHVNVSGAGVAKNAPNRAAAIAFLEFLATPEAQVLNSEMNNEFPGANGVQAPAGVREFEGFAAHPMNVSVYGRRQSEAQSIMTAAGWR
jgi:iron(III) transport system substrate-binding protein